MRHKKFDRNNFTFIFILTYRSGQLDLNPNWPKPFETFCFSGIQDCTKIYQLHLHAQIYILGQTTETEAQGYTYRLWYCYRLLHFLKCLSFSLLVSCPCCISVLNTAHVRRFVQCMVDYWKEKNLYFCAKITLIPKLMMVTLRVHREPLNSG